MPGTMTGMKFKGGKETPSSIQTVYSTVEHTEKKRGIQDTG